MSETISLRLPRETLRKLSIVADREGKDRSTLIREFLERGVKEKDLDNVAISPEDL